MQPAATTRKAHNADPRPEPVRHRSRGIALVLALVLGFVGAHRFYLGYYGSGLLYVAGVLTFALVLSLVGLALFGGGIAGALGYLTVLAFIELGLFIWNLVDIVRIVTNDLRPKNGEYNRRFF